MERMSLREWQKRFGAGEFDNGDTRTQCDAGWYDWFCKDTSLKNKTLKYGKWLMKLTGSAKVNLDTMYVFFKNNCPISYPLYDSVKICDIETGDVLFCINMNDRSEETNIVVYGPRIGWGNIEFACNTTKELVNWLNAKEND